MSRNNNTVPPFFQLEHAQHGLAISGLSAVRAGLYDGLKLIYWQNHCALPFGKDELNRLKRVLPVVDFTDEDLLEVLDEYFPDGHHADLDAQRWGINQTRTKAKASAAARWGKEDTAADTFDQPVGVQPVSTKPAAPDADF